MDRPNSRNLLFVEMSPYSAPLPDRRHFLRFLDDELHAPRDVQPPVRRLSSGLNATPEHVLPLVVGAAAAAADEAGRELNEQEDAMMRAVRQVTFQESGILLAAMHVVRLDGMFLRPLHEALGDYLATNDGAQLRRIADALRACGMLDVARMLEQNPASMRNVLVLLEVLVADALGVATALAL